MQRLLSYDAHRAERFDTLRQAKVFADVLKEHSSAKGYQLQPIKTEGQYVVAEWCDGHLNGFIIRVID